jgi:NADPH:quinone reductase-like Zn-dependent oxidoreductase
MARLQPGQKVLIHAAAGGVGSFAVQLAKWKGAYVIGTASERNLQYVRDLGADEVVDYRNHVFEADAHDVDVVLDTIGGETQRRSWQTLKKGGVLISTVQPPSMEEAAAFGVCGSQVSVQPNGEQLSQIGQLADSGRLNVLVETVLPLTEARRAQELSETGHTRGKIVLRVI